MKSVIMPTYCLNWFSQSLWMESVRCISCLWIWAQYVWHALFIVSVKTLFPIYISNIINSCISKFRQASKAQKHCKSLVFLLWYSTGEAEHFETRDKISVVSPTISIYPKKVQEIWKNPSYMSPRGRSGKPCFSALLSHSMILYLAYFRTSLRAYIWLPI